MVRVFVGPFVLFCQQVELEQGEFQHQSYTVRSPHDSDHDGAVRVFIGHL